MDSGREFIDRNYMHAQAAAGRAAPAATNRAAARFNRIRVLLLAFNVAASLALIAFAISAIL